MIIPTVGVNQVLRTHFRALKVTVTVTVSTLVIHCWWRHTTGCASQIKDILNKNFIVTGFVNVGSNTFTMADCGKETIGNLTKNCFSILGGTNGIGKNKANEGLKQILISVEGNSCTNKILTCIPYRFELHEWSVMCEYCSWVIQSKNMKDYEETVHM
jgi:hypothetical protein